MSNLLRDISLPSLRRAVEIKGQINELQDELGAIMVDAFSPPNGRTNKVQEASPDKPHWTQTPKGRRRMARIQRKSWKHRRMAMA